MKKYLIAILLLLLAASGSMLSAQDTLTLRCIEPDSVITEAMKHLGVPYRWGGKTPKGFDCAGFTRYVYSKFGVQLAPSAAPQYKMGIPVDKDSLAVGDLVFFSGRRNMKAIGHVGIVTTVKEGSFDFIHASSTGIRITSSQEAYYLKRYKGACRLIDREEVLEAGLPLTATDTVLRDPLYTIAMVGDIMLGTLHPTIQLPLHEGKHLFDHTKDILNNATVAVGNCEGVFSDDTLTSTKEGCKYCYAFRMPESYAALLQEAGFDFLSLANNHSNDFGRKGIMTTIGLLDSLGIGYAGIKDLCTTALEQRDSLVFGFCAFGTNGHNCNLMDSTLVMNTIRGLREECDILIVSFHGGAEGAAYTHLPEGMELFLDEKRGALRKFAHMCIDEGADLVFGHGPHVCRAMELYRGHLIAYSLGNFCTPTGMSLSGVLGYAPIVTARLDRNGMLVDGKIHSFLQPFRMGPQADNNNNAAKLIKTLSEEDFQTATLIIDDNGSFRPVAVE